MPASDRCMTLGHEVGGTVAAIGAKVKTLSIGDRVTTPIGHACGDCGHCRRGHQNRCDRMFTPLLQDTVGWAEFMCVRNADLNADRLPETVDDLAAAALGCRHVTAFNAVRDRAGLIGGETVVVIGCGGVGLAAVEIASALGGRVIAVDLDDKKLDQALSLGAFATVNARDLDPAAAGAKVKTHAKDGHGAQICIDAMGGTSTLHTAFASVQKGGRLVIVGMTGKDEKGSVSIPVDLCAMLELTIVGCSGMAVHGYDELLALVADGKLNPSALVSRTVRLSDVQEVLTDLASFQVSGYAAITEMDK
jgi:D-arabinose 1-dehydrogenase-like Zn-dependent alcohol dehydrogenase